LFFFFLCCCCHCCFPAFVPHSPALIRILPALSPPSVAFSGSVLPHLRSHLPASFAFAGSRSYLAGPSPLPLFALSHPVRHLPHSPALVRILPAPFRPLVRVRHPRFVHLVVWHCLSHLPCLRASCSRCGCFCARCPAALVDCWTLVFNSFLFIASHT